MFEAALALALLYSSGLEEVGRANWNSLFEARRVEESVSKSTVASEILLAAKEQVARKTPYRFSFPSINYPFGDVPMDWGLCCDVIVRSCRAAGIDLQQLVYEDSLAERDRYIEANRYHQFSRPLNRSWAHRRTSNLNLFLQRFATALPTQFNPDRSNEWQAGDIVIYRKDGRVTWHVAIVSDTRDPDTLIPKVIDAWLNPGYVSENHLLTDHGTIAGHYRLTDTFRNTLPEEHRESAVAAWKEFLGETPPLGDRVADSHYSQDASSPNRSGSEGLPLLGWTAR